MECACEARVSRQGHRAAPARDWSLPRRCCAGAESLWGRSDQTAESLHRRYAPGVGLGETNRGGGGGRRRSGGAGVPSGHAGAEKVGPAIRPRAGRGHAAGLPRRGGRCLGRHGLVGDRRFNRTPATEFCQARFRSDPPGSHRSADSRWSADALARRRDAADSLCAAEKRLVFVRPFGSPAAEGGPESRRPMIVEFKSWPAHPRNSAGIGVVPTSPRREQRHPSTHPQPVLHCNLDNQQTRDQ